MEKEIYVICPANWVTGGPDALHQMVYYLNLIGKKATIVYDDYILDKKEISIPTPYKPYVDSFKVLSEVKSNGNHTWVVPETYVYLCNQLPSERIYIWWLSVDNEKSYVSTKWKLGYLLSFPIRYVKNVKKYRKKSLKYIGKAFFKKKYNFKNEKKNISHCCASYYAFDYIQKNSKRQAKLCIEPISKYFLEEYFKRINNVSERKNIILYNPKKSSRIVERLLKTTNRFTFVPLKNMNQLELIEAYSDAKLYLDFGPFPGAERMPKEAVLFGCAIITGKHGASAYYGDVPIPDKYKFEDNEINEIIEMIDYIFANYQSIISDFEDYKNRVLSLEDGFKEALDNIF